MPSFIYKIASKRKPRYKLLANDNLPLSPSTTGMLKTLTHSLKTSFSPLSSVGPKKKARVEGLASDGGVFEKVMDGASFDLWREKSPGKKSPNRVRTKPVDFETIKNNKKLLFAHKSHTKKKPTEYFEFKVTKEDILKFRRKSRECSQKKVMGNVSAYELMQALGLVPKPKQGGRLFHWAHRRGKCVGGAQTSDNLDPMTAAANYFTLFLLEIPLTKLLLAGRVPEVLVQGMIHFNPETGLPSQIKYHLSWGLMDFININIDPMSHSRPSFDDCLMSQKILSWQTDLAYASTPAIPT